MYKVIVEINCSPLLVKEEFIMEGIDVRSLEWGIQKNKNVTIVSVEQLATTTAIGALSKIDSLITKAKGE